MQWELLLLQLSMMNVPQWLLTGLAVVWMLWGLYVLIMGLYRAHLDERLTRAGLVLAIPYLSAGYALDVIVNLLIASVLFAEIPREWLVTDRLTRLHDRSDWRGHLARWICENLLDYFDPSGRHCGPASGEPSTN